MHGEQMPVVCALTPSTSSCDDETKSALSSNQSPLTSPSINLVLPTSFAASVNKRDVRAEAAADGGDGASNGGSSGGGGGGGGDGDSGKGDDGENDRVLSLSEVGAAPAGWQEHGLYPLAGTARGPRWLHIYVCVTLCDVRRYKALAGPFTMYDNTPRRTTPSQNAPKPMAKPFHLGFLL